MKPTAMLLSACVLAAIGGAVGGATINTTPIQRAGVGAPDFMRDPASFAGSADLNAEPALPDHYDIITPEGRIEVAELTANGIYAQKRFARYDDGTLPLPAEAPADPPVWVESWRPLSEREPISEPEIATPPTSSLVEQPGQARIIDVAAELAAG